MLLDKGIHDAVRENVGISGQLLSFSFCRVMKENYGILVLLQQCLSPRAIYNVTEGEGESEFSLLQRKNSEPSPTHPAPK